ncbi:hypothetical protein FGO68_gene8073 [Halteria grandinella]|uniref:Uncharacterized protein n=1 Tax=Halteria grandinella TaxID=5974 RepID=A0A8J8NFX2_HALGN|nr:hypothetical protein FGO68_gene8073 [Halteria grandinella]
MNFSPDASEAEIQKLKKDQILSILHFLTTYGAFFALVLSLQHHFEGLPGSPYIRACYPFTAVAINTVMKYCLRRGIDTEGKFLEKHVGQIVNVVLMLLLNEEQIFLSPNQFKISPVLLSFICIEEHFNTMIGATCKEKNAQRLLLWVYYAIRNIIHYGKCQLGLNEIQIMSQKIYSSTQQQSQYSREYQAESTQTTLSASRRRRQKFKTPLRTPSI